MITIFQVVASGGDYAESFYEQPVASFTSKEVAQEYLESNCQLFNNAPFVKDPSEVESWFMPNDDVSYSGDAYQNGEAWWVVELKVYDDILEMKE